VSSSNGRVPRERESELIEAAQRRIKYKQCLREGKLHESPYGANESVDNDQFTDAAMLADYAVSIIIINKAT
jgi:hypothetical protein